VLASIGPGDGGPLLTFSGDILTPIELLKATDVPAMLARRLTRSMPRLDGIRELQLDVAMPRRDIALWVSNANRDRPGIVHFTKHVRRHFAALKGE